MIIRTKSHPDIMGQAVKFRSVMGQPVGCFAPEVLNMQLDLIKEEVEEFTEAYGECLDSIQNMRARSEALKELADLVYVAFQFAAACGWELDEALDRVHKSNMSKLVNGQPLRREDGKVLKGPNYKKPELNDLV